ncbi:MAG: glycosyltransferase, partial [Betaproteobacteria bacterium]|nr:glycosyltransferase [Betaproteobacteria bacterium]
MAFPENGGKGRVVRLAFSRAKHDFLIFMDGDLAYSF